jgi:hypothetical protein
MALFTLTTQLFVINSFELAVLIHDPIDVLISYPNASDHGRNFHVVQRSKA